MKSLLLIASLISSGSMAEEFKYMDTVCLIPSKIPIATKRILDFHRAGYQMILVDIFETPQGVTYEGMITLPLKDKDYNTYMRFHNTEIRHKISKTEVCPTK